MFISILGVWTPHRGKGDRNVCLIVGLIAVVSLCLMRTAASVEQAAPDESPEFSAGCCAIHRFLRREPGFLCGERRRYGRPRPFLRLLAGGYSLVVGVVTALRHHRPGRGKPTTRTQRRSTAPQPFPGLTHKPHCAACEQVAEDHENRTWMPRPVGGEEKSSRRRRVSVRRPAWQANARVMRSTRRSII